MVNQSESSDILSSTTLPLSAFNASCTLANAAQFTTAMDGNTNGSNMVAEKSSIADTSVHVKRGKESAQDGREFVCGWGAAFINITCTFPMNKIMFRQMLHGVSTKKAVDQLKAEGLKTLYRGILPPLCQKTVSTSIMFGMYDQYTKFLRLHCPGLSAGTVLSSAAVLAGVTEAMLCPFERIQTLMQDRNFHHKYRNTLHCYRALQVHGSSEFYRGLSLVLFRNGASNIMFFGLRGPIKNSLDSWSHTDWWGDMAANFVSGAVLGAFISTIMYPINVLKTQQQVMVGVPFASVRTTVAAVYRERGWKVFHGIHVNYTRALVSWGIINASYEMLLKMLYTDS